MKLSYCSYNIGQKFVSLASACCVRSRILNVEPEPWKTERAVGPGVETVGYYLWRVVVVRQSYSCTCHTLPHSLISIRQLTFMTSQSYTEIRSFTIPTRKISHKINYFSSTSHVFLHGVLFKISKDKFFGRFGCFKQYWRPFLIEGNFTTVRSFLVLSLILQNPLKSISYFHAFKFPVNRFGFGKGHLRY